MRTLLKYTAQAARRREPTVGQEAVSTRSRKRRPVRSQWSPPRQGRLKTACCLSARGVATAKQRFDRAVGTAGAPFSKYKNSSFFQRNKIAKDAATLKLTRSIRYMPNAPRQFRRDNKGSYVILVRGLCRRRFHRACALRLPRPFLCTSHT